jgi:hypothetical protein
LKHELIIFYFYNSILFLDIIKNIFIKNNKHYNNK